MTDRVYRSGKRRIFVSSALEGSPASWTLSDANAHYLTRVLRLREGTAVDLADGSGRLFAGTLRAHDDTWVLEDLHIAHQETLHPPRIVAAALIKPDRWEWMLEKAAEIGATHILPIQAAHSVVRIPDKKVAKRLERWQRILEGAARQCERLSPVTIDAPCTLQEAIAQTEYTHRLMLDEAVPNRAWPALELQQPIALFIGPEGGWNDDEREALQQAPAQSVGLGRNLLRAETAAISALTIVRALDHQIL